MKAVVVIDMPTRCSNCHFCWKIFNECGKESYYCSLHRMSVPKNGDVCKKLRPLPQKLEISEDELYEKQYMCFEGGWNACLDEIDGS